MHQRITVVVLCVCVCVCVCVCLSVCYHSFGDIIHSYVTTIIEISFVQYSPDFSKCVLFRTMVS